MFQAVLHLSVGFSVTNVLSLLNALEEESAVFRVLVSEVFLVFLSCTNMGGLHTKSTKLLVVFVTLSTCRVDGFCSLLLKHSCEGRILGLLKISEKGVTV